MKTDNSGLLSIVVPIYNVSEYLDRCVKSLIMQSYKNVEIILVDDGSLDDSGEKCDRWKEKDSRIIVIHKINGGLADARNAGIECAKGEYISFVDGDDSVSKEIYVTMINMMKSNNAGISCCGKKKIYPNKKIVLTQSSEKEVVLNSREAIGYLLDGKIIDESCCDKVFKKELFNGIRFPKGEINEDLPIMPIIFSRSNKLVHVGENFYHYYQNSGSITRSGYSSKMSVYIEHLNKIERFIIKNYPSLKTNLNLLKVRYCLSMIFRINNEPNGKQIYHSDYKWYCNNFRKNYYSYIKSDSSSIKEKIISTFVYFGLAKMICIVNNTRKSIINLKKGKEHE